MTLHLPMVAELPITMLACARLGVIHSQVFSGFSGKATQTALSTPKARVLITMGTPMTGAANFSITKRKQTSRSRNRKGGRKA